MLKTNLINLDARIFLFFFFFHEQAFIPNVFGQFSLLSIEDTGIFFKFANHRE